MGEGGRRGPADTEQGTSPATRWLETYPARGTPALTAFVGLPVPPALQATTGGARRELGPDPDLVQRIATAAAAWGSAGAEDTLLEHGARLDVEGDDAHERWVGAAARGPIATQLWVASEAGVYRSFGFARGGCAVAQVGGAGEGWETRLESLQQLLRTIGASADLAWCDHAPQLASWRSSPRLTERGLAQHAELRTSFVPDAHGVMVLTPEHVARAKDLGDWRSETLGADRTLLVHREPAAWFADVVPDQGVLAKARADLGPMILTDDDVREHRVSLGLPG